MNNNDAVLISINDLANRLNVAKSTIYYWVHCKKIPFFKAGKHLRFDPNAVLEHLKSEVSVSNNQQNTSNCSLKIEEIMKKRGNSQK